MQIRHDRKIHSAAIHTIGSDTRAEEEWVPIKKFIAKSWKNNKGAAEDNRNPMLVFFSIQLIEPQSDVFHAISRFILYFLLQLFQFKHIVWWELKNICAIAINFQNIRGAFLFRNRKLFNSLSASMITQYRFSF